jgi:hypothetical protein
MDLIEATASPGSHLRRHTRFRRTDREFVADYCIPRARTGILTGDVTPQALGARSIDPLIVQELPASDVAAAERVQVVATELMLEACDVTGRGLCDAKKRR